jgi:UDP-N-acetylmuramoylalanine--D-glutamate ligase
MIIVMGYGRSGRAVAEQLSRIGAKGAVTEMKSMPDAPRYPGLRYLFGEHPMDLLDRASLVVVSPGVPWDHVFLKEARRRGVATVSDVEWAGLQLKGRKIGVTGSNGKSTTTRMLTAILCAAGFAAEEAANAGVPLASFLGGPERDWYVLELSSFQLEGMQMPMLDAGVLLNITPDHLDRHPSLEAYADLKRHLFDLLLPGAPAMAPLGMEVNRKAFRFGRGAAGDMDVTDRTLWYHAEPILQRDDFPPKGDHNWMNAGAAALAALELHVPSEAVRRALSSFEGLEHRMEVIPSADGLLYINDSKGTNVDSVLAALTGVPAGRTLLILGGKDKGGNFTVLKDPIARTCKAVFCIGQAGSVIYAQLEDLAVPRCRVPALADVFDHLKEAARPGDCVLLSPGCASFDQYANFEERGRHFKTLVKACPGN